MMQRRWAVVVVEVPAASHSVTASHDQQVVVAEVTYIHAHYCHEHNVALNKTLSFINIW